MGNNNLMCRDSLFSEPEGLSTGQQVVVVERSSLMI